MKVKASRIFTGINSRLAFTFIIFFTLLEKDFLFYGQSKYILQRNRLAIENQVFPTSGENFISLAQRFKVPREYLWLSLTDDVFSWRWPCGSSINVI